MGPKGFEPFISKGFYDLLFKNSADAPSTKASTGVELRKDIMLINLRAESAGGYSTDFLLWWKSTDGKSPLRCKTNIELGSRRFYHIWRIIMYVSIQRVKGILQVWRV
jgi:hypothetical protein